MPDAEPTRPDPPTGSTPPVPSTRPTGTSGTPVGAVADVRRAPRYRVFAVTGMGLAALVALAVALLGGRDDASGVAVVVTVLGAAAGGALLGTLVAVVLDRRR